MFTARTASSLADSWKISKYLSLTFTHIHSSGDRDVWWNWSELTVYDWPWLLGTPDRPSSWCRGKSSQSLQTGQTRADRPLPLYFRDSGLSVLGTISSAVSLAKISITGWADCSSLQYIVIGLTPSNLVIHCSYNILRCRIACVVYYLSFFQPVSSVRVCLSIFSFQCAWIFIYIV